MLHIQDLGAGSRKNPGQRKMIKEIAGVALKSKKYAQLIYRLVKHYKPQTIIELGTSLGITIAYIANANSNAEIITIEGSEQVAAIAKENLNLLHINNVQVVQGNFDNILSSLLINLPSVDLAYIDGNHRYEPTIRYFQQFLQKTDDYSILIFDDIHWSVEMEMAWNEIKAHPSVKYTIDIFFLGFVFFRKEFNVKQDFIIRF
jgi:predicted O-methyltransferase YrrM